MSVSEVAFAANPALRALRTLRGETACVRALLDEIERVAPSPLDEQALSAQLAEELARLGCRVLEAAAALATAVEAEQPTSGVRLISEALETAPSRRSAS